MVIRRKKRLKKRIPKLCHTDNRGIGYYVAYRDSKTDQPVKHRFGNVSREEALQLYQQWVSDYLAGETPPRPKRKSKQAEEPTIKRKTVVADIRQTSLLAITEGMLRWDEQRVRPDDAPRTKGMITGKEFNSIRDLAHYFLKFLNKQYGQGAVATMALAELTQEDVEAYNVHLVKEGYSDSQVRKRLQVVKSIIDRAGRTQHGKQVLSWNWNSLNILPGKAAKKIIIPTVDQLKAVLRKCDKQHTAMVWLAIGCGFGQSDLTVLRVGHFDEKTYDLTRLKTGIERYGSTPKLVWKCMQDYLEETPRRVGELLFLTEEGMPLVHNSEKSRTDSVAKWWGELRGSLGEVGHGLNGFYSLRHLGATEYGERPGCSISAIRRFLGHGDMETAARYMKPVKPQYRAVVDWVRSALKTGKVDLRDKR